MQFRQSEEMRPHDHSRPIWFHDDKANLACVGFAGAFHRSESSRRVPAIGGRAGASQSCTEVTFVANDPICAIYLQ
jgi:hypothetical protein